MKKRMIENTVRKAASALALMLLALLTACAGGSGSSSPVVSEGGGLVIPVGDVTETPAFYPAEVDGTQMEIIAVRAPDGTVRTAFNTCQVCYDSGRGYYKQSGGELICQNCGNRFDAGRIGVEKNGCNPWPIDGEDRTVTEESVTISYDFLKGFEGVFASWKRS